MVLYGGGSVGLASLVKSIFDKVLKENRDVPRVAFALVGAYLLKGVGAYVSGYFMTGVGQRVVMDIRNKLFRHILEQSAAFFSGKTSGQLISRITNDVNQVQMAVSET